MPIVVISPEEMQHKPDAPYARILQDAGLEIRYPSNPHFARGLGGDAETIEELRGAAAVLAGGEYFGKHALENLPDLRVIARVGVGFDRVDVETATRRNVAVTITPTANHEAVAEHAMALLLATAKRIVGDDTMLRSGQWKRRLTHPVRGSTLGLVGLGRIGRSLAVRALAFRMRVIACEPNADPGFVAEHGIELTDLPTLLASSDYVSLHCPLTPQTRGLFHRETLAQMKPGAVLINTARGGLVVEADLIEALRSGHLRAAGLDVFESEPIAPDHPLLKMDNVVVTPHTAGGDTRSLLDMGIEAAHAVATLYRGQWPAGQVVNAELEPSFRW